MVVGYAMADNYMTPLMIDALDRGPQCHARWRCDLPFRSRQQYTSDEFAATSPSSDCAVGRSDRICYDNAMAESFFAALKNERVHRTAYPTREHARADVARYIEFWYNNKRLHSGLDYKSPKASPSGPNEQEAA